MNVEALNQLDQERESLPKICPSWCSGGPEGHQEALMEGCDVESASVHLSPDLTGSQGEIRNYVSGDVSRHGKGGWRVQLRQQARGRFDEMALIEVELHVRTDAAPSYVHTELELTTGEARQLAAQLLHLADQEDLRRYDNHL